MTLLRPFCILMLVMVAGLVSLPAQASSFKVLSDEDANRYRAAFSATDRGDFQAVGDFSTLKDQSLVGVCLNCKSCCTPKLTKPHSKS
jgi:hypothetical protein